MNQDNPDDKPSFSLTREKAAVFTGKIQEKRRKEKLSNRRDEKPKNEEEKGKDLDEDLDEDIDDNEDLTSENMDEYFRKLNEEEGITEEQLEQEIASKASKLIPLWQDMIKELQVLDESWRATWALPSLEVISKWTKKEVDELNLLVGSLHSIRPFIGGVGMSLANLEGNIDDKSLAIVASRGRLTLLEEILKKIEGSNLGLDLESVKGLIDNLKMVYGDMKDYSLKDFTEV